MSVLASQVAVIPVVQLAAVFQVAIRTVTVIKNVILQTTAALIFKMFHVFQVSLVYCIIQVFIMICGQNVNVVCLPFLYFNDYFIFVLQQHLGQLMCNAYLLPTLK